MSVDLSNRFGVHRREDGRVRLRRAGKLLAGVDGPAAANAAAWMLALLTEDERVLAGHIYRAARGEPPGPEGGEPWLS